MFLEAKLKKLIDNLYSGPESIRDRRIFTLYSGFDGFGTRTIEQVKVIVKDEFDVQISGERVRQIFKEGEVEFSRNLEWDKECESIVNFINKQVPIDVELLAKRFADPSFESFSHNASLMPPVSKKPFNCTGILKLLSFRPSKMPKLKFESQKFYPQKDTNIKKPHYRNVHYTRRHYLVPLKFSENLKPLLAHAIRAIMFNGMIKEQCLVPLIPADIPVYKREELAHSLVTSRTDFKWLDKQKGLFTYTSIVDNRLTSIAKKIFLVVDSIHVSLLAHLLSRAVKAPARVLFRENDSETFSKRSDLLRNVAFSAKNEVRVQDCITYFKNSGLLDIDENNICTPTPLLLDNVEVKLRSTERSILGIFKDLDKEVLPQTEMRKITIERLKNEKMDEYFVTLNNMLASGELCLSSDGKNICLPESTVESFNRRTQNSINNEKLLLNNSKRENQDAISELIQRCKAKQRKTSDSIKNLKSEKRLLSKDKTAEAKIRVAKLNESIEDHFLFRSMFSSPDTRLEEISYQIGRIESQHAKCKSVEGREKLSERLLLAKSKIENHELEPDVIRLKQLRNNLLDIDRDLTNLPKVNTKFVDLIINVFFDIAHLTPDSGYCVSIDDYKKTLTDLAQSAELDHATANFSSMFSYSPLIVKLDDNKYTVLGTSASANQFIYR